MPNHSLVCAKQFSLLFLHAFVVANTQKTLITQMCSLICVQIELDPTTMYSPAFSTSKLDTLSHKITHAYAIFSYRKFLATIIGVKGHGGVKSYTGTQRFGIIKIIKSPRLHLLNKKNNIVKY